jgi:hypothetical protein
MADMWRHLTGDTPDTASGDEPAGATVTAADLDDDTLAAWVPAYAHATGDADRAVLDAGLAKTQRHATGQAYLLEMAGPSASGGH